jgi:hypothetical protein
VLQPSAVPHTSTGLQTAVQLNLARALTGGGASLEAAQRYEELELAAELYDQPPAWLAYAAAKRSNGDVGGAVQAAGLAVGTGGCAALRKKLPQHLKKQAVIRRNSRIATAQPGRSSFKCWTDTWSPKCLLTHQQLAPSLPPYTQAPLPSCSRPLCAQPCS